MINKGTYANPIQIISYLQLFQFSASHHDGVAYSVEFVEGNDGLRKQ